MANISLTIRLDLQNTDVQNVLSKLEGTFKNLVSNANQFQVSFDNLNKSFNNIKSHASILDDTFTKIGLRMQGIVSVIQIINKSFGDFINSSNNAEEASASLIQALQ